MAYVFAREYSSNNIQCVNKLKQQTQNIKTYYANDNTPCGGSFSSINEQHSSVSVTVYPNPASGEINFKVNEEISYDFVLYDRLGRETIKMRDQRGELHLRDLPASGIYYYRIVPQDKYSALTGKVIIR